MADVEEPIIKRCSKCGSQKPLAKFYLRKSGPRAGEPHAACKACCREKQRSWREANPDHNREWQSNNRERLAARQREWRAAHPDYQREWERKNHEKVREYNRRTRERYPDRNPAHCAVRYAKKTGRLKPEPCEDCGSGKDVHEHQAHHPDYSKPLDVTWLCRPCHTARHKADLPTKKG